MQSPPPYDESQMQATMPYDDSTKMKPTMIPYDNSTKLQPQSTPDNRFNPAMSYPSSARVQPSATPYASPNMVLVVDPTERETGRCLRQLNHAFCCFSLRVGTLIVGWVYAFSCLGLTLDYLDMAPHEYAGFDAISMNNYIIDATAEEKFVYVLGLSILVLYTMFAFATIIGVYKRSAAWLKPFVVSMTICCVFSSIAILGYLKESERATPEFTFKLIFSTLFGIYSVLVVNSYRTVLRNQSFGYRLQGNV